MARISAHIDPKSLGYTTRIEVILPQRDTPVGKILYMLHGLGGDCTAWGRLSRIEEYAEQRGYAVIMPEVQRSLYTDMAHGNDYFTYVAYELPQIVETLFNLKHSRGKTFVAGLSMGGYGALKCGLTRPDFYGACAGFSGFLDPPSHLHKLREQNDPWNMAKQLRGIFGVEMIYPDASNIFLLAEKVALLPEKDKPRVLVTCGDADFLLADSRRFDAHMKQLAIPYTYKEWPGEHNWKFWEECLPVLFEFLEGDSQ